MDVCHTHNPGEAMLFPLMYLRLYFTEDYQKEDGSEGAVIEAFEKWLPMRGN